MKQFSLKTTLALGGAALALVGGLALSSLGTGTRIAHAQEKATTSLLRTITVVGEGKVSIKPDVARATIGVEVLKPTVKEASAENKTMIEAVLAALKEAGIAEEDIQTSGFSIYLERFNPDGSQPEKANYRVSNNVTVIIRDLETVGEVLDAAVEAGANNIYGVEFSLDDTKAVKSEVRKEAVANALEKAEELASLNAAKVGQVVSISEVIGTNGGFYNGTIAEFSRPMGGGALIAPGQLDIIMQLQVTYAIAE